MKNGYFTNMVDKFLHKIDLDALQKEVGKTIDEIGALIEMKRWAKLQTELPSYPYLINVLKYNLISKRYQFIERTIRKFCDFIHGMASF